MRALCISAKVAYYYTKNLFVIESRHCHYFLFSYVVSHVWLLISSERHFHYISVKTWNKIVPYLSCQLRMSVCKNVCSLFASYCRKAINPFFSISNTHYEFQLKSRIVYLLGGKILCQQRELFACFSCLLHIYVQTQTTREDYMTSFSTIRSKVNIT